MTHTQAVFLAHWLSFCVVFQLWCWYKFEKRKKARRCANTKRAQGKSFNSSISQLIRKNNRSL